uniref:Uncharacterized protein n=1 Tax=Rhizophora mucronata TaxID=61149 RepID=A0A2P2NQ65_RHIMU
MDRNLMTTKKHVNVQSHIMIETINTFQLFISSPKINLT